jgi:hypothetical protein
MTDYPFEDVLFIFLFGLYVAVCLATCLPLYLYDRTRRVKK